MTRTNALLRDSIVTYIQRNAYNRAGFKVVVRIYSKVSSELWVSVVEQVLIEVRDHVWYKIRNQAEEESYD